MAKERLDAAMVARGLASGREQAKRMVMAGEVYIGEQKAAKPSQLVAEEEAIEVRGARCPFVSRGGLKLLRAFEVFGLSVEGLVCADVGASTGGFTDCLLQHGAKRVYAIDVGYGQLDYRLRTDPRVAVMERTNARAMEPEWFEEAPQFACMDVSFISIRLILPALLRCLTPGAQAAVLVKPQFEAGREKVGKKGVVRDAAVHREVLLGMLDFVRAAGFSVLGLDHSPIKGPEGNVEFLLWLKAGAGVDSLPAEADEDAVKGVLQKVGAFFSA